MERRLDRNYMSPDFTCVCDLLAFLFSIGKGESVCCVLCFADSNAKALSSQAF